MKNIRASLSNICKSQLENQCKSGWQSEENKGYLLRWSTQKKLREVSCPIFLLEVPILLQTNAVEKLMIWRTWGHNNNLKKNQTFVDEMDNKKNRLPKIQKTLRHTSSSDFEWEFCTKLPLEILEIYAVASIWWLAWPHLLSLMSVLVTLLVMPADIHWKYRMSLLNVTALSSLSLGAIHHSVITRHCFQPPYQTIR